MKEERRSGCSGLKMRWHFLGRLVLGCFIRVRPIVLMAVHVSTSEGLLSNDINRKLRVPYLHLALSPAETLEEP